MSKYTQNHCPHCFPKLDGEAEINQVTTQGGIKLQHGLELQRRTAWYQESAHQGASDP